MMNFSKLPILKVLMVLILISGIISYCFSLIYGAFIYENNTASAPQGLYYRTMRQKLKPGDYAIIRLPQDLPAYKLKKGYLLLKKAAAAPGTFYEIKKENLVYNGKSYPIYDVPIQPKQELGIHKVPENSYLFLNDPETSLDSRYLGPISDAEVVARVELLVDYKKVTYLYRTIFRGDCNLCLP